MLEKKILLNEYKSILAHHNIDLDDLSPREKGKISNLKHNELRDKNYRNLKNDSACLEDYLMNYYCYAVSMLESRQRCIEYNDIEFSRRVGEVWEGMCQLILTNPLSKTTKSFPKTTESFNDAVQKKIIQFSKDEKHDEANAFHSFLVSLMGNINLKLDFNGVSQDEKIIGIDFKSGFGSNEKGNTQRILQVGKIYKFLDENIDLSLVVRQNENNNYYNTIKNSGIWNAIKGNSSYDYLAEISGCDASAFLSGEVDFSADIEPDVFSSIGNSVSNRDKYITWYL